MENVENERSTKYVVVDEPTTNAEEHVAVRLKALRQGKGWSQADLAVRMTERGFSWHQTTVAKTEGADRPLRLNEADALAAALGVHLLELLRVEPVEYDGDAAAAHERLNVAEKVHAVRYETALDFARELGEAQGRLNVIQEAYEKTQAALTDATRDLVEARADFAAAIGEVEHDG